MADRDGARRGSRWLPIAAVTSVALVAPLVALPIAGRALADFLGRKAGEGLAEALPCREAPDPGAEAEAIPAIDPPEELLDPLPSTPRVATPPSVKAPATEGHASRRGVLIRADLVARAVKSGARPSAVPVPASGMRPEGLALYGVGGFGAGLRDGDVVTLVAGAPASSVGALIGAISGVIRARARSLSAVVWRGDQRLLVTVEIPPIAKLGRLGRKDAGLRGP